MLIIIECKKFKTSLNDSDIRHYITNSEILDETDIF